jgi:phage shock protein A
MSGELSADGYKIDGPSQRMLRALRGGEWKRSAILRNAGDLEDNRQVSYRMEKYLGPAGLVIEAVRDEPERESRRFKLTEEGEAWVEDHAEELLAPTTREEIADLAQQGYKEGTEAKESVQSYRKKLSRYKNQVEDVREQLAHIRDHHDEYFNRVSSVEKESEDSRERSKEAKQGVKELRGAVEARATVESMESVSEDVSGLERRLTAVESKQDGLAREQAEAAHTRALVSRLAKPAGYVAAGALAVYLLVLVVVLVVAPGLLVSVLVGGATGALGVAVGIGGMVYARGTGVLP